MHQYHRQYHPEQSCMSTDRVLTKSYPKQPFLELTLRQEVATGESADTTPSLDITHLGIEKCLEVCQCQTLTGSNTAPRGKVPDNIGLGVSSTLAA